MKKIYELIGLGQHKSQNSQYLFDKIAPFLSCPLRRRAARRADILPPVGARKNLHSLTGGSIVRLSPAGGKYKGGR